MFPEESAKPKKRKKETTCLTILKQVAKPIQTLETNSGKKVEHKKNECNIDTQRAIE
jgi:hypothetical protein